MPGEMMESTCEATVGVIGIGNLLLKDEGFGVHAVRELARVSPRADVKFIDGGTDPWSAFEQAAECQALLVLDAVQGGKRPGDFHSLPFDEVEPGEAVLSLHGLTMFHLLQYEAVLGNSFREVRVLGIEPAAVEPDIGLSGPCRQRLDKFVQVAVQEIDGLLERVGRP